MAEGVDPRELHSIRSAARYCGVTPGTVRNWILTKRLDATKANNRTYIKEGDLDVIVAERRTAGRASSKS